MNLDFHSAAARGLRRYVRLVAAAMDPAVDCAVVQWDHPANAYLALTGRLHWFPGDDVALTWDSRYGWAMILVTRTRRTLFTLRYLGGDLLPAPPAVAAFSGRIFRDEFAGQADPPPARATGDVRELVDRLGRYAVPPHCPRRRRVGPVHLYGVVTSHPGRA